MDAIQELLARDQIRQLAERYALGVDARDLEGIAAQFSVRSRWGKYGVGREGALTFYDNVLRRFHCTMHLVANHVIDFDDETHAHGIVYCRAHHHVSEPEHWFDMALAYWDQYELEDDGRWRITRRDLKAWYTQWWGHPDHGVERETAEPTVEGARKGQQMPDSFATWTSFDGTEPRPLPAREI
jgi:ketosteroid isomerase-like protein